MIFFGQRECIVSKLCSQRIVNMVQVLSSPQNFDAATVATGLAPKNIDHVLPC